MKNVRNYASLTITNPSPFRVPSVNIKRNAQRYSNVNLILREYMHDVLIPHFPELHQAMIGLFTIADRSCIQDQELLVKEFSELRTWYITYVLTGSKDISALQYVDYRVSESTPELLIRLIGLIDSIKKDHPKLNDLHRFIIGYLDIGKVFVIPKAPSLDPITAPFSGSDESGSLINLQACSKFLGLLSDDLKQLFHRKIQAFSFHESSAAGPNGHALWSAHLDDLALKDSPELSGHINDLCEQLGIKTIPMVRSRTHQIFSVHEQLTNLTESFKHSRLHLIFEKGIKTRIIAIADYFSQAVLTVFLDYTKAILKMIPCDWTYDQDGGFESVCSMSRRGLQLYSFDLSKATDRLPVKFQTRLLSFLISDPRIAELWRAIMVDRTFLTENGHEVRYAVGQPQGMKSSFNMMALSHHYIVAQSALNVGLSEFHDYAILGDDIVIGDAKVAQAYQSIIAELGVEISLHKSLLPNQDTVSFMSGAEFCKRLCLNGTELTGLPVHSIANTLTNQDLVLPLWEDMIKKSILPPSELYNFFARFVRKENLKWLFLLNSLPSSVSGLRSPAPYGPAVAFDPTNWPRSKGYSLQDFKDVYYYVLITSQLSKLDGLLRKASSWLSIALEGSKLNISDESYSVGMASIPLGIAIKEKLQRVDASEQVFHPVTFAAKALAHRVLQVLNSFTVNDEQLRGLLFSKGLAALSVSLDSKPSFKGHSQSVVADRIILERTLILLKELVNSDDQSRSFVGSLSGVSQAWNIRVGLGKGLLVMPHAATIKKVNVNASSLLSSAAGEDFDF